jgi:hypothetical protein
MMQRGGHVVLNLWVASRLCTTSASEAKRCFLRSLSSGSRRIGKTNALFKPRADAGPACDVGGVPRAAR